MNSWWIYWFIFAGLPIIIGLILFACKRRKWSIGNAQLLGSAQVQNDYFASYETKNGILAIVSDGIGRNEWGRRCAEVVVNTYLQEYKQAKEIVDPILFLQRTLRLANQRVTQLGLDIGCGATVSVVILKDHEVYWLNVGCSAIMVIEKEEIIRLNDTYTQVYINEPAYKRKPKAYYDQYMGLEDDLRAQVGHCKIQQQSIVLCTDGVYLQISEMDMLRILKRPISAYDQAQEILLTIARKERTDQDNATIIVLTT